MGTERTATLTSDQSTPDGTFGRLVTDSGFECRTLERLAEGDHPCIPAGDYDVVWTTHHPHHPGCYEITGVPGRTDILIHSANWYEQLLGCVAPGKTVEVVEGAWEGRPLKHMGVTASKATLAALVADLGQQPFRLKVVRADGRPG